MNMQLFYRLLINYKNNFFKIVSRAELNILKGPILPLSRSLPKLVLEHRVLEVTVSTAVKKNTV